MLSEITRQVQSGQLTKADLEAAVNLGGANADVLSHRFNLSEILYYIGGGIVFLGICVLSYQNWDWFGSFLRIFITLGSTIAAFLIAVVLSRYPNLTKVSQAFFLISGLLAPLGLNVTLKESGVIIDQDGVQILIYAILSGIYLTAFKIFRQSILLFFGIVFCTGLYHYIINILVANNFDSSNQDKIWEYRILTIGMGYLLLGYYLSKTSQAALRGIMYGFGAVGFLGAAMALGGWTPNQNVFWELIYPLLVFGLIYLSVPTKSKALLTFGTLFLIGYVIKITNEYFTSGLGWPLALVLCGFAIMGIGYYAVRFNKKYLS